MHACMMVFKMRLVGLVSALSRCLAVFCFCFCFLRPQESHGFAYAPNFITKIVQEQTGIQPMGLVDIIMNDNYGNKKNENDNNKDDDGLCDNNTNKNPKATAAADRRPVMTRFPPEPNGYLHLGHAKAVCFNFAVARMFGGTCNMRMDDTNPSKEDEEYVESILKDVKWIQSGLYQGTEPWDGEVKKTSDYFDIIYDAAVVLIQQGDAYVDSLSAEEMRDYRGTLTEPGKDSPFRTRSIQENLELFEGVSTLAEGSFFNKQQTISAHTTVVLVSQDEGW
jgi:tRNA synthetases class I (E and Q), catalytic domain